MLESSLHMYYLQKISQPSHNNLQPLDYSKVIYCFKGLFNQEPLGITFILADNE